MFPLIILLYALFGSSFLLGKILLGYTDQPIFLAGIRMSLAGVILLAYQYFYPHATFRIKKKHIWLYLQIIFFGIYVTYILRFWALRDLSSSKTSFFLNLSPFMSSLYSYFIFKERMSTRKWIGLVIGVVGLIPVLLTTSPVEKGLGEFFFISWQELAVIVSVAAHAYSWIIMRKLVKYKNYDPGMINGLTMTFGGFLALITSFFVEKNICITNSAAFAGYLALVILISNIICHNLYGYLLRRYTATFLSFAGFLTPLFAAFYGWLFLHETITAEYYLSAVIVFIGLFVFYYEEVKKEAIH